MNKITSKSKKLKEGKKFKINKFAAGVAFLASVTVGSVMYSLMTPEEKPTLIIPTQKPIETITPTPTATVTPISEIKGENTCKIPLVGYYVHKNENLTEIVDMFYGQKIDEYNLYDDEKEYNRISRQLIETIAAVNHTDPDLIPQDRTILIVSPEDINEDNMDIVFSRNSEYYVDNDNCIQFVKTNSNEYDPSVETTDGMIKDDNSNYRLVSTIDYFNVSDDGYFTVNAYKYIVGENFDLYEFIKSTYTSQLLSVGYSGGDLQQAYNHIADSIITLNPAKFSYNIEPGDELIVINPNSINDENYMFVLYTNPIEYDEICNRVTYYVYPILQEMQVKGRTY